MMDVKANLKGIAAATLLGAAGVANAASVENSMTNIVTIIDSCDVVAIGVDFGIRSGSITSDVTAALIAGSNTTAGNTATGNTAHPDAGKDGGATATPEEDTLTLSTGVGVVDTVISTALTDVLTALTGPGVYAACTTTPTRLFLESQANGKAIAELPVTAGVVNVDTFQSDLAGVDGPALTDNGKIDYKLAFAGTVASVPGGVPGVPAIYTGIYTAIGTIPAATNTDLKPTGHYTDVALATLEF